MGHVLSDKGLEIDETKVDAIKKLKVPKNCEELQRLLGMVNYLGKFVPCLSQLTAPLRILLKNDVAWIWGPEQEQAFKGIKEALSSTPVLRYYDVKEDVTLSVDASSKALGAVLMQKGQPVAYATKSLNSTEQDYPQIVKEALAIRYGCKKFHDYVWGKKLTVETDHKPLETIWKKPLVNAPPRLRRILLDLKEYSPDIIFKKGSELKIADTLSRDCEDSYEEDEEELQVLMVLSMSESVTEDFRRSTLEDPTCQALIKMMNKGWPDDVLQVPQILRTFFTFRDELSHCDGLIFKGDRVFVPENERIRVLEVIHKGHPGIQATLRRSRQFVFWEGLTKDVIRLVESCKTCQHTQRKPDKETIIMKKIPKLPFEIVSSDVFSYKSNSYLVLADSYSGYYEVQKMTRTTASEMISQFKIWFATHGVPQEFHSDNAVYSSREFAKFAKEWNFKLVTSSPHFARSNGLAEKYVDIAKRLVKRCDISGEDLQLALLMSRNTPRDQELGTPSSRLFGRNTRTPISLSNNHLQPKLQTDVSQKLEKKEHNRRNILIAEPKNHKDIEMTRKS